MIKKYLHIILSMFFFLSCSQKFKTIEEQFNSLSDVDYSDFENISIVSRKDVYYVKYQNNKLLIRHNFFRTSIEQEDTDVPINLSNNDKKNIENTFHSFKKMNVSGLVVDDKSNVFISIPWSGYCTYYFLKLSDANSLKDLEKQYYQHYKGRWYLYKECARSGW